MLKWGEQQHINRRRQFISVHCFRLVWTSGWCHSLFILNVVGNILISTNLLIWDRNLYAQVPHFSKVKVNTRLINDKDWWQRHFCSNWKKAISHKYLILQRVFPMHQNLWWSILFLTLFSIVWSGEHSGGHWSTHCVEPWCYSNTDSIFLWFEKAVVDYSLI